MQIIRTLLKLSWLFGCVLFIFTLRLSPAHAEKPATAYVLNNIGDIIKIDLREGKVLERKYIPEAYYAGKIGIDPKGRYLAVNGGEQLFLFLDPENFEIQGKLAPELEVLKGRRYDPYDNYYEGKWVITPDGSKIYFSGLYEDINPMVIIDPFGKSIIKKIDDFRLTEHPVFSADGKLLFNLFQDKIVIFDVVSDTVKKWVVAPDECGVFAGQPYIDSSGKGVFSETRYGGKKERRLLMVNFNEETGKTCKVNGADASAKKSMDYYMNDFMGDYMFSWRAKYLVINEYVDRREDQYLRSIYQGRLHIIDMNTQEETILSFTDKYQPTEWGYHFTPIPIPGEDKIVYVLIEQRQSISYRDFDPRLRHRKLEEGFALLVIDLNEKKVVTTVKVADGGFKDIAIHMGQ